VTEGAFAYTSGSQPGLGTDGKFQVVRDKVVIGRTLAEDEVDFESGFIMVPPAVPEAPVEAALGETVSVPGVAGAGATEQAGASGALTPTEGAPATARPSSVRLKFKATRDQVFKAFPAIANLADKSDEGKVTVNIEGSSSEGFDRSWLRNAVEEPLQEADIEITEE
jgi:hypothetical protein